MNLLESIQKAKDKKYSISYYSEDGEVKEGEPFVRIGFKNNCNAKSQHVWYWFDVAYHDKNYIMFSHWYSCNTGASGKSYKRGSQFRESLLK